MLLYRVAAPVRPSMLSIMLLSVLAACQRQPQPAAQTPAAAQPAQVQTSDGSTAEGAAAPLSDVIENTPSHVLGISYPPGLEMQPGLLQLVRNYADKARAELKQAVDALDGEVPSAPYELSLSFEKVLQTPQFLVIAADGSRYTGGAHGSPLVARFVWLVQAQKQLTAAELIPAVQGWQSVGRYVSAQLHQAAAARAQAGARSAQEMKSVLGRVDSMIAAGTSANAENFAQFQPVLNADGKIAALRFVFAPYQVGPYSDGTQSVDVPAAVLLPVVAQEYLPLFAH